MVYLSHLYVHLMYPHTHTLLTPTPCSHTSREAGSGRPRSRDSRHQRALGPLTTKAAQVRLRGALVSVPSTHKPQEPARPSLHLHPNPHEGHRPTLLSVVDSGGVANLATRVETRWAAGPIAHSLRTHRGYPCTSSPRVMHTQRGGLRATTSRQSPPYSLRSWLLSARRRG